MLRFMPISGRLLALHAYALLCVFTAVSGLVLTLWKYPPGSEAAKVALMPDTDQGNFMGLDVPSAHTL